MRPASASLGIISRGACSLARDGPTAVGVVAAAIRSIPSVTATSFLASVDARVKGARRKP